MFVQIDTRAGTRAKQSGFSLFELVVFILSVAIIYSLAANRFAAFPGQAERANFLAVATQIQTAVNLEMIAGLGSGRLASTEELAGANPMELLLEPPSNYLGAFSNLETETVVRRSWYFDEIRNELVYLVNDPTGVFLIQDGVAVPAPEVRFSLMADYSVFDRISNLPVNIVERDGKEVAQANRVEKFKGIVFRPVVPYRWDQASLDA